MSQELSTGSRIAPVGDKPFAALTVEQREFVLLEVSKGLHYAALVSRAVQDKAAKDMATVADKIDQEHERLAADYSSASGEVLYKAVELIDGFHRRMS